MQDSRDEKPETSNQLQLRIYINGGTLRVLSKRTQQLILSALFIALGVAFPILFHMAGLGKMFLPMFWPMAAASFFLSIPFVCMISILTPLTSFLLTGMPPMPILQLMMVEIAVMTISICTLYQRSALGAAWLVGIGVLLSRLITYFAAGFIGPLIGLPDDVYSISRILTGIPGVIAIWVIIPILISRIQHIPLFYSVRHHVDRAPSIF